MQSITAYEKTENADLEQFVVKHLPLVKKIALYIKRRLPSHVEFDDLLQSGLVGLLEAKNNFDPEAGASFETYAGIRIRGAIIDSLRKNSWISRDTVRKMKIVSDAILKIEQREKRAATTEDIIAELNIAPEDYFQLSQEINIWHVSNLEMIEEIEASKPDNEDNPEEILSREGMKTGLKKILAKLPEREQLVLSLYYIDELTFKEIGEVLELTEARICQLHSQAITRIRAKMQSE